MTATHFIWIRHAPTGIDDRWIGRTDVPAMLPHPEKLGSLWDALNHVDHVACSPMIRARQTAAALFPDHAAQRIAGLEEQDFGDWEDQRYSDCRMPLDMDAAALAAFKSPGGESLAEVCQRVAPVIDRLRRTHSGQTLAIVAHAGVIRAALVHALSAAPASGIAFQIAHLSLTRIDVFGIGAAIHCVNDRIID